MLVLEDERPICVDLADVLSASGARNLEAVKICDAIRALP